MRAAMSGHGVDRHLLGLRTRLSPTELASTPLFTDPAFGKSMNFELSTSSLSPGECYWGGFGAVVKTGYGINYCIGKDGVKFSISSWKDGGTEGSASFGQRVMEAMNDLGNLMEQGDHMNKV